MIELTIKTLDSRNHAFTVGDEFTVKQLKEHIAEAVNVPAESQRLIYCGRVLVDDKKLTEYDVNGKVIHLVQRAPPSSSTETGNSGSEPRQSARRPFRATIFNQGGIRVDGAAGNAMYLGAMAFPADLMDAQGINLPNPRHVSQSRLAVVRSFIRRARYALQTLENPAISESPAEYSAPQPAPTQAPVPMDFAFVAQALSDAVTRAAGHLSNNPATPVMNVEVVTTNDTARPAESSAEPTPTSGEPAEATQPETANARSESPEEASTTPPNTAEDSGNTTRENGQRPQNSRFSRPSALADLVSQAMSIQTRLSPYLDRYYELLREDPALENHQDAQRLFSSVSELLHHMAHAYHAISDVMCDFAQPPPRLLQCRPVLIHHSAVLQTGIPIQVNLGGGSQSRGTATSSSEGERSGEDTLADSNGNSANAAPQPPPTGGVSEPRLSRRAQAEVERVEAQRRRERTDRTPSPPREQRQGAARAFNITPGGLEFIMDVGQGSLHIDSVETVIPGSGAFSAPPDVPAAASPELLNFWQALGHVTNIANRVSNAVSAAASGQVPTTTESTSSPSAGTNANPSSSRPLSANLPGVQAWTNTDTQPTTSTQTRATTRPHVQISPGLQGVGMPGFFDPFLPCSSHHIRNHMRRSQGQTEEEASTTQTGPQRARAANPETTSSVGANVTSAGGTDTGTGT